MSCCGKMSGGGEGAIGPEGPAGPAGADGPEGPEGPQGPEGLLTAGTAIGQLVWWDGADWVPTPTPTVAGQILRWDGAAWVLASQFASVLSWAATSVIATSTSYLFPGGSDSQNTAAPPIGRYTVPTTGTVKRLWVRHNSPTGVSALVYTLEVNDVASLLTAALSSAITGPASDLVNEIAVVAGDSLRMNVNNPGAIVGVRPNVVIEYHVP